MSDGSEPPIPPDVADRPAQPFLQRVAERLAAVRHEYADYHEVGTDGLFLAFLLECARFGRFEFGPISIDVDVYEDRFARTYVRTPPGQPTAGYAPSARRFYDQVAAEVARSGRRRVDELHWLLAFMRTNEGLPADVFAELGVTPEQVEAFARRSARRSGGEPERLYSPEEVAEYLRVHVQTVRAWIRSGELPAMRLAGRRDLRVRASDLGAVLEPVEPTEAPGPERRRGS